VKAERIKIENNTQLRGNIFLQPSADPKNVLKVHDGATFTGETYKLGAGVPIPRAGGPEDGGSGLGDVKFSSGVVTINVNSEIKKLEMDGTATLEIGGVTTIYITDDIKLRDSAQIRLLPGAVVDIYAAKHAHIEDNALINANTADPTRLTWHQIKSHVELEKGNPQMHAVFIGREGDLRLKDDAQFFGQFLGRKLKVEKRAQFHADLAVAGGVSNLGDGFNQGTGVIYTIRWIMNQP